METFDQKQVFEWGKQSVGITEKQIANCVNGAGMIGVKPAGLEIVNLKDYLPEYPERKEVKYTFTSVASYCQYVNEQKNEYVASSREDAGIETSGSSPVPPPLPVASSREDAWIETSCYGKRRRQKKGG